MKKRNPRIISVLEIYTSFFPTRALAIFDFQFLCINSVFGMCACISLFTLSSGNLKGEIVNLTYPDLLGWPKRFFLDKFKIENCWKDEDQHSGRRSPWGETRDKSVLLSRQRHKGIHSKETKSKTTLSKAHKAL